MTQEFQKWVKLGGELGLVADELKVFIKERQEEVKAERLRVEAVELQKLQLQKEADERRLALEEKRLAAEKLEREAKFAAEKEADERRFALEEKRLAAEKSERDDKLAAEKEADERRFDFEEKGLAAEKSERDDKLAAEKEADERRLALEEKRLAAEKSERDDKLAAEKLEREARLAAEADERRIAAEREKEERDLKRLDIQTQEKIRLKELDVRLAQDSRRSEVVQVTNGQEDTRSDNYGRIRDIQMPAYDSEVDDLDIWLCRFDRCCTAFRINKDLWVLAMIKSLKGHALEVYERMRADEAHDYEKLKGELLKRFRLTEGGYRRKFKSAMKEKDETTLQFGERLNRYLEKWLQMSGFEEDYDGLKMLI